MPPLAFGVGAAVYFEPGLGTATLVAVAVSGPLYALLSKTGGGNEQADTREDKGESRTPIEPEHLGEGGETSAVEEPAAPESEV